MDLKLWYLRFSYIPTGSPYIINGYVKVRAKNKRHARKVFFKFVKTIIKRREVKTISHIQILDIPTMPSAFIDDYDGPSHFWESKPYII